ncbi:hypothetical protein S245_028345 [Arachis hypogaea]
MSLVQGRLTPLKQCELSYFEHTFEYCKPSCEEPLHYTFDVRWRFRPCCRREAPPLFVHPSPTRGFKEEITMVTKGSLAEEGEEGGMMQTQLTLSSPMQSNMNHIKTSP